jgi:hypothetical protein
MPRQEELEERVGVLEAQIKRLLERRPDIEGGREYILKESDQWIVGITERKDGTFSSVWMEVKH